ncbi:MAG: PilZ domain-containing protein [Desulfofustis sp.]|jgi:hypothetical protein|nr:PilZ domain-containing protein [Desulfofustis sp.]
MEKRKHPRMVMSNLEADISDGKGFFSGVVNDISRFGLSITDVPKRLDRSADIYSIIVDGPGTHFKLLARPIWEEDDGSYKVIGAQIENSPWTWTEFVMRHEPEVEGDLRNKAN